MLEIKDVEIPGLLKTPFSRREDAIEFEGRSVDPVDEPSPSLVWLEDLSGARLSNSVPLDHRLRVSALTVLNNFSESPYQPRVSLRVCISAAEISLLLAQETG